MSTALIIGGDPFGSGLANAVLQDLDLIDHLSSYKKRIAGNYRALLPEDIGTLPGNDILVSTKIDGEMWFLISHKGNVFFSNPRGRVIAGKLALLESAAGLPDNTIIAGELHVKVDEGRCRVGDLASLIAKGKQADLDRLCFGAFDVVKSQDADTQSAYPERLAALKKLIKSSKNLFVVDSKESDRKELSERFESEVLSGKSEGLIARLNTGLVYKLKPAITIDAAIIAYTPNGDKARSVLLGLMTPDGLMQVFGGCGNLGSDENRRDLLKKLESLKASSSIRWASETGSLYSFVKPQIIAEIKLTDLQAEHSDGTVSKAMRLQFQDDEWKNTGMASCPRPIHPVLINLRDDKVANVTDIRISQVSDYAAAEKLAVVGTQISPSSIIRREIWSKETKGVVGVRKLLVWKTNKQDLGVGFPAYVVHWTDYSPGRASPLDRDVKLASDEKTALALADSMVEDNIKKGWEKYSSA
jgi:hypothetical protein